MFFRQWLGAVRRPDIAWPDVRPNLEQQTAAVSHVRPNLEQQTAAVSHVRPNLEQQTSAVSHVRPNLEQQTAAVSHVRPNLEQQTAAVSHVRPNLEQQTSAVSHVRPNLEQQTAAVSHVRPNLEQQTAAVSHIRPNLEQQTAVVNHVSNIKYHSFDNNERIKYMLVWHNVLQQRNIAVIIPTHFIILFIWLSFRKSASTSWMLTWNTSLPSTAVTIAWFSCWGAEITGYVCHSRHHLSSVCEVWDQGTPHLSQCRAEFINFRNMKYILIVNYFSALTYRNVKGPRFKGNDLFIPHIQYHGCWWPGDARSQCISSHGIALVILESSCFVPGVKGR